MELRLALNPTSEPISGRVEESGGVQIDFVGWIGLMRALDQLVERPSTRDGDHVEP